MKVHYTGRRAGVADISDAQKKKLQTKFDKIHKILGRRHSSEAHVIVSRERHLYGVEVTLNAFNHTMVVTASSTDVVGSLQQALEKLEKQAIKNKHKMIDGRRPLRQRGEPSPSIEAALNSERAVADKDGGERPRPRVVHSNAIASKPLTLEGAIMQLDEQGGDHLAYRDAENGQMRVLLRRRDGVLELVEAS